MSLDGWTRQGINGFNDSVYKTRRSLTGGVIPADRIFVLVTASAAPGLAPKTDSVADVDWQNGPDAAQLLDPTSTIVDALQYGDAGSNNAGEGTPAPDPGAGSSLSRYAFGTETNDNATDFVVLASPTPGVGPAPVPEPGTASLVISGLAILAARARRTGGRESRSAIGAGAPGVPSAVSGAAIRDRCGVSEGSQRTTSQGFV
jgi:hypothetical protein